jgi:hypothetical protein
LSFLGKKCETGKEKEENVREKGRKGEGKIENGK